MKNLIIIGAGNLGREVLAWAKQSKDYGRVWNIKGFLDDREGILANFGLSVGVISAVENYRPTEDDVFICAIGEPAARKKYASIIRQQGGEFVNIVHPTAVIEGNVKMGIGIIVGPLAVVSVNVSLGNFVVVYFHANVAHDVIVGDWCQISPGCALNGGVVLEESVFVGSQSVIIPRKRVGARAIVGAGSVVVKDVPSECTVYGNPARIAPGSHH